MGNKSWVCLVHGAKALPVCGVCVKVSTDGYTLAKSVLRTEDLYGDAIRGMAPFGKWDDAVKLAKKIVEGVEG